MFIHSTKHAKWHFPLWRAYLEIAVLVWIFLSRLAEQKAVHEAAQQALRLAQERQKLEQQALAEQQAQEELHAQEEEQPQAQQAITEQRDSEERQGLVEQEPLAEQLSHHQMSAEQQQEIYNEPEEYVPSPVSSSQTGGYQPLSYQPSSVSAQPSDEVSQAQSTDSTTSITMQGEEDSGGDRDMPSMSWPPHNSPTMSSAETAPSRSMNEPSPPVQLNPQFSNKMPSPVRPPIFQSVPYTAVQTLAPHIQITPTISAGAPPRPARPARPPGTIVTYSSTPPPPPPPITRTISNEQQQDALDLLDSIHTEGAEQAAAVEGNPIQTLGNKTMSPVFNRVYPTMSRPPAPPPRPRFNNYNNYGPPPPKRPYQQYNQNYPYY